MLILLAALGLRLTAAAVLQHRLPGRFLLGDSETYWVLGENLARGEAYRYGTDPDQGRVMRMPGYPVFLAALLCPMTTLWPVQPDALAASSSHFATHLDAVRLLQTLIGVLAVYLVYRLGRTLWDRRVGLTAAALAAVYPAFVGFTPLVLSETLFAVLLLAHLLACVALGRALGEGRRATGTALGVGVLWGLATLVRGSWITSGVVLLPVLLWRRLPRTRPSMTGSDQTPARPRIAAFALVLAAFVATMAPWWIRNAALTGRFVPTTLFVGASLYDGMHPGATGESDMGFLEEVKRLRLSEYEQDRLLRRRALEYARTHPGHMLQLAAIKFLRFWNIWPNAPQFRSWPLRVMILLSFVPVMALGLYGLLRHRGRGRPVALLAVPLVYLCLVHVVFVGSLRYRLPGMYPWMVLAAAALASSAGGRDPRHDQRRTRNVYGLLWTRYGPIRAEQDEATFYAKTGFAREQLRGRRVLDAGCGNGRYLRIAAAAAARVVAMDLSASVFRARAVWEGEAPAEPAQQKLRPPQSVAPRVGFVQGDLLAPPLAEASFDAVFAIGVLEHTPDPHRVFRNLVRLLRPGGVLAVWLHPKWRPALEHIDRLQRAVSSRLPPRCLAAASRALVPLGALKRRLLAGGRPARLLGRTLHVMTLGVSLHPDPATRCCDTFNWYAPRWRSHHTAEEVRGWFQDEGLIDVRDLSDQADPYHAGQGAGINFSGRRPA